MAEILRSCESRLEFSNFVIGETELVLDAYGSIERANTYFDNRLRVRYWKLAETSERKASLSEATRLIDRLNFLGCKTEEGQLKQFPRDGDSQVPVSVEPATYEIALKLLEGYDPDMEQDALSDLGQSYGGVRSTYDRSFVQDHIRAGIPSATAWSYLKPFIRDAESFKLCRVD